MGEALPFVLGIRSEYGVHEFPGVEGLEKDEFPPQLATIAGTLLLEQRNSDEQSIFDPLTSILKKFFPRK